MPVLSASPSKKQAAAKVLGPTVAETGLISVSIDGCGSLNATCPIDVEKPVWRDGP